MIDDPLPSLFSLKARPEPTRAPPRGRLAITAALVVVALAGVAALFRAEVETVAPGTVPAYAAVLGAR